jgi:hypothetical protein
LVGLVGLIPVFVNTRAQRHSQEESGFTIRNELAVSSQETSPPISATVDRGDEKSIQSPSEIKHQYAIGFKHPIHAMTDGGRLLRHRARRFYKTPSWVSI